MIKNRLYFMAGYMPEIEHSERTINLCRRAPAPGSRIASVITRLSRVDFNPTQKLQTNVSWIWSPAKRIGSLPNRDARVAAPTNDLSVQGGYVPSQAFTASGNYTVTPKLLVSVRYGYKYINAKEGNYGLSTSPYIIYNTDAPKVAGVPAPWQQGSGYRNVSSTFGIERDETTRHNIYVDGTYIWSAGKQQHTFKMGWMMNKAHEIIVDDFTNGEFTINWGDTFSRGSINKATGTYGYLHLGRRRPPQ